MFGAGATDGDTHAAGEGVGLGEAAGFGEFVIGFGTFGDDGGADVLGVGGQGVEDAGVAWVAGVKVGGWGGRGEEGSGEGDEGGCREARG